MPAEAIHLTILADGVPPRGGEGGHGLPGRLRAFLDAPAHREAARLGAVLVDLPYFQRFPLVAARYVLGLEQAESPWGDLFHRHAPAAVGRALLDEARALGGEAGERLLALALGYHSHLAADTQIHPLVNRLARARARAAGTTEMSEHHAIEKYQSVLFHEERNGFDFMGRAEVSEYVGIDAGVMRGLASAVSRGIARVAGRAPAERDWAGWARGYRQYAWTLGSPFGRTLAPRAAKDAWRSRVEGFGEHMLQAVKRSRAYVEAAWSYAVGEADAGALADAVPEGSIDEPPAANLTRFPVPQATGG